MLTTLLDAAPSFAQDSPAVIANALQAWVRSGPHLMLIVPDPAELEGFPTDPENGGPWVMWKGAPTRMS
ncbi:hypothetical protein BH23GEM9_BH23GEM9_28980 [soil metagenome]